MKVTKTIELDRLKMIYPSSVENLILKQCFLQRFLSGLKDGVKGWFRCPSTNEWSVIGSATSQATEGTKRTKGTEGGTKTTKAIGVLQTEA